MRKTSKAIPVNYMGGEQDPGISVEKLSVDDLPGEDTLHESHRHDRHSFFLLEKGTVSIEVDFKKHQLKPSTIMYMHPDQVHRITVFKDVRVSSWGIDNENLHPEYLQLLEQINPAAPLVLEKEAFSVLLNAVSSLMDLSKRNRDQLYHTLLRDSCNVLVGLVIAHYLAQVKPTDKLTRFEIVTQDFRKMLEHHYTMYKRPADYSQQLNISTPYLNECVRNVTGHSVSYHIQQRVILEAKRMLHHSDKSVKEIASVLGYDDYPYFSRFFVKVTGITPLAFRNKNHD